MKRLPALTLTGLILGLPLAASADHPNARGESIAYARVLAATPVYKTMERNNPVEVCWPETVQESHGGQYRSSSPVIGGIVGGAIGHAVGHGSKNKKVGAAVGALLGAAIGNDLEQGRRSSRPHQVTYREVERCELRDNITTWQELVGYDVKYQYNGQTYATHMREHPGRNVKLAVSVRPVGY